jgi:WD40 repeat protein
MSLRVWTRPTRRYFPLLLGLLLTSPGGAAAPPPLLVDTLGDPLPPGALARYGSTRLRHGSLAWMQFTRDGKYLLSLGERDLRLWEAASGKLVARRRLELEVLAGGHIILARNGFYVVAMGGIDYLADFHSARRRIREEAGDMPSCAALSPDGKVLAVGYYGGGRLLLLDAADGKVKATLPVAAGAGGPADTTEIAFSPDGRLLATAAADGRIVIWDAARAAHLVEYPPEGKAAGTMRVLPAGMSFSPDGSLLAVASLAHQLRLLQTSVAKRLPGFAAPAEMLIAARFSDDGKQLVGIDEEGRFCRYEARTGKRLALVESTGGMTGGTHYTVFSADGKAVALVEGASTIRVLDGNTGKPLHPHLAGRAPLRTLRWRGGDVVCLTETNQVRRWDPRTGRQLGVESLPETEPVVDLDPGGHRVAVAGDGEPSVLQLPGKKKLWKADGAAGAPFAPRFSRDGRWLAMRTEGAIEVREAATGKHWRSLRREALRPVIRELGGVAGPVVWSSRGHMLATLEGAEDRVTLHELATGQVRYTLRTPQPIGAAFSPDDRLLATASAQGVVRIYRLGRARPLFEVVVGGLLSVAVGGRGLDGIALAEGGAMSPFAFSPDGKLLAAASGEDVRVWDLTGRPVGVFRGHEEAVLDVSFSPDGRALASASADGTALVWALSWLSRPHPAAAEPPRPESLWDDLASDDAGRAFRAMTALEGRPALAVALLAARLAPAVAPKARLVRKLLDDLDADAAAVRRRALRGLEALDVQAEGELTKVLASAPSAEVRKAIRGLLARLEGPPVDPARLREVRAVEVLETAATPRAREVLRRLAGGADSRLAREAKAALGRLPPRGDR